MMELLEDGQTSFEDLLLKAIQNSVDEIAADSLNELSTWVQRVRYQLRHIRTDVQILAPWLMALAEAPTPVSTADKKEEFEQNWTQLMATLSLYPQVGDIPKVRMRPGTAAPPAAWTAEGGCPYTG